HRRTSRSVTERQRGRRIHIRTATRTTRGTKPATTAEHARKHVRQIRIITTGREPHTRASTARTSGPAATKHAAKEILETVTTATRTSREAGTALRHRPIRVVLLTLLLIGEHRVRFTNLFEFVLRLRIVRVRIRMHLARQFAVRLLNLSGLSVLRDAENLIKIFFQPVWTGHRRPSLLFCLSQCSTLHCDPRRRHYGPTTATRAARRIFSPTR